MSIWLLTDSRALDPPCNERTTCAAARHKPNFPSQPKPRHSLPCQVRALLRDGEREQTNPTTDLCLGIVETPTDANIVRLDHCEATCHLATVFSNSI